MNNLKSTDLDSIYHSDPGICTYFFGAVSASKPKSGWY